MGLDMYLSKRRYVKNWNFEEDKPELKWKITVTRGGQEIKDSCPVEQIIYSVAYWRKANAIHQWFVDNVQEGEDDCKEYWVGREQLQNLYNKCLEVKAKVKIETAQIQNGTKFENGKSEPIMQEGRKILNDEEIAQILPTSNGFFFGSTDYNEWYLRDIDDTIDQLKPLLEDDLQDCEYYYQASW